MMMRECPVTWDWGGMAREVDLTILAALTTASSPSCLLRSSCLCHLENAGPSPLVPCPRNETHLQRRMDVAPIRCLIPTCPQLSLWPPKPVSLILTIPLGPVFAVAGEGPYPAAYECLHDLQQAAPGPCPPASPQPGQQDRQQDLGRVVVCPGAQGEAEIPRPGLPGNTSSSWLLPSFLWWVDE